MSWWKEIGAETQFKSYLALGVKETPSQSQLRGWRAPYISFKWKQVILRFHWKSNFLCVKHVWCRPQRGTWTSSLENQGASGEGTSPVIVQRMKGSWLEAHGTSTFVSFWKSTGNTHWSRKTKFIRWGRASPWQYLNSVSEGGSQGRISNKVSGPGLGKFSVRPCKIEYKLGLEKVYYVIALDRWALRSQGLEAILDEQAISLNKLAIGSHSYPQGTSTSGASS